MQMKMSRERGRPRGIYHNLADFKALEYLSILSLKYGIESNDFLNKFIEAWEHQKSTCKSLSINCCKKTLGSAVFLITKGVKVVAQFPIPKNILKETNPFKNFAPTKRGR